MNTFGGEQAVSTGDRVRTSSRRVAGAISSAALAMCLGGASQPHEVAATTRAMEMSVFDADCADANTMKLVDQNGHESVVVRLDCVPDNKANKKGAVVLSVIRERSGMASGSRVADDTILEAICRETDALDGFAVEYEGENNEWVQLADRTQSASLDGMPLVDGMGAKTKYVNSAYVVGERVLPECSVEA